MKRIVRVVSIAVGCSLLLGLGTPAHAEEVGPATVEGGDPSADASGVTVAPAIVSVTNVPGLGPTFAQTGPITVATDGSAHVSPSVVCLDQYQNWFFGTVCSAAVYQEGATVDGSDATVGSTTYCMFMFPGIFCDLQAGFVKFKNGSVHAAPTTLTGTTFADDRRVSTAEAAECLQLGDNLTCWTIGRVSVTDNSGVKTTATEVCMLPQESFGTCVVIAGQKAR